MTVTLYTTTDTGSANAIRNWLTQHNINFQERNLVQIPLSASEIRNLLQQIGSKPHRLISLNNTTVCEELYNIDQSSQIDWLASHPSLITQPFIIENDCILMGFDADQLEAFFPRHIRMMESVQQLELAN